MIIIELKLPSRIYKDGPQTHLSEEEITEQLVTTRTYQNQFCTKRQAVPTTLIS